MGLVQKSRKWRLKLELGHVEHKIRPENPYVKSRIESKRLSRALKIGTLNMIWILLAICGNAILYIWALGTFFGIFICNSLITFCHFKILKKHTNRPIIVICKYVVFVAHRCFYCLLVWQKTLSHHPLLQYTGVLMLLCYVALSIHSFVKHMYVFVCVGPIYFWPKNWQAKTNSSSQFPDPIKAAYHDSWPLLYFAFCCYCCWLSF